VPIRTPLQDASREVEDSIRAYTVRVRSGRSRRVGTAVSRIAAPRVKRVTPGVLPRVVAAGRTLPFRLGREPASGPGTEGAGLVAGDAGNREGLGHPPDRRLRRRSARRSQEALVLAPRHLGLIHEEAAYVDDVPRMLGRLAFGRRASHLEFPARNANHDGAVLLAPEFLAALRVPPERTEPVRRRGGALHEGEGNTGPASLLDACDGTRLTHRSILADELPLTPAHGAEDDRTLA